MTSKLTERESALLEYGFDQGIRYGALVFADYFMQLAATSDSTEYLKSLETAFTSFYEQQMEKSSQGTGQFSPGRSDDADNGKETGGSSREILETTDK